jgi:hypothetical protein
VGLAGVGPTTKRIQVQIQLGYILNLSKIAAVNLAVRDSTFVGEHFHPVNAVLVCFCLKMRSKNERPNTFYAFPQLTATLPDV